MCHGNTGYEFRTPLRISCRKAHSHLLGERPDNLHAKRFGALKAKASRQPRTFVVHGERYG
jgi:hypothetical protein